MNAKKSIVGKRKRSLERELVRIKKALIKWGAEKIILFGSLARGFVGRTTDIDLLVIKNTDASFSKRLNDVYNCTIPKVSADILVYTQSELDELSRWNIFIRRVLKEGKVIYAA